MKRISTKNKYYGKGFIVSKEGAKYYLEYQLARQGGGSRKFEISREVYEDARDGSKTTTYLLKKYDLYDMDNPENDV